MKVCHFVTYTANSEYTRNLGTGLDKAGVKQVWLTLFRSGGEKPEWVSRSQNVAFECLNADSKFDFPLTAVRLASVLRREKVDIIQTHLYEASFVGFIAASIARIPVKILTRHHTDQALLSGNRLPVFLDKWEARIADAVVVLGGGVKRHLVENEGVSQEKVHVIHQGFDFKRFTASNDDAAGIRSELQIPEEAFVIGTFGSFFPTKGHRYLLRAAASLNGALSRSVLLFVGAGGDQQEVAREADRLGLSNRVIFAGFRNDVPALMKACDVVVHPSLSEAFCQVLIETMSVGTPIISTDVGSADEVIQDGKTGTLLAPSNPKHIAAAIEDVHKNPKLYESIADEGKRFVQEKFTIEEMIRKQLDLYERLHRGKH